MSKMNWSKANKMKNIGMPENASWGENWLKKHDKMLGKPRGAAANPKSKQATGRIS